MLKVCAFLYRNVAFVTLSAGLLHWYALQRRHNGRDGVSNHQSHHRLLKHLFRRRSKKTSKLHVTGLCEGISLVTGEFPAQKASNAKKGFHLMTSSWGQSPGSLTIERSNLENMAIKPHKFLNGLVWFHATYWRRLLKDFHPILKIL